MERSEEAAKRKRKEEMVDWRIAGRMGGEIKKEKVV